VEGDATKLGYGWVPVVYLVVTALTAGAALRGFGVVFLGWGPRQEEEAAGEGAEFEEEGGEPPTARERHVPLFQYVPPVLLLAAALGLGLVPDLASWAVHAAERFQDRDAYAGLVLHGRPPDPLALRAAGPRWVDVGWSLGASALAVAVALLALWRRRVPGAVRRAALRVDELVLARATALQSGHVGDYVAWLTLGTAVFGAAFALTLR
jgi:multicomponent Na+:H+ antiporter subunit D